MPQRAALVTGGSSGIGLGIARVLADEGFALTVSARRPDKLERAAEELRSLGAEVLAVPGNVALEEDVAGVVSRHREAHGRLDVLVNNAGLGIGGPVDQLQTKHVDLQLAVNLRSMILFYREAMPLLRAAGAESGALVVNTSSITGKVGTAMLSVYSATKHGMVGFTQAMNDELRDAGIKSCALCPAYVDTDLANYAGNEVAGTDMIRVEDVAESVRYLLRLSPNCVIPEFVFARPADSVV
jgi:NAD(P)-dependent dehydrogenase (short-subunit alcohol dehydrogenase family)